MSCSLISNNPRVSYILNFICKNIVNTRTIFRFTLVSIKEITGYSPSDKNSVSNPSTSEFVAEFSRFKLKSLIMYVSIFFGRAFITFSNSNKNYWWTIYNTSIYCFIAFGYFDKKSLKMR